jgi:hypothetical protein
VLVFFLHNQHRKDNYKINTLINSTNKSNEKIAERYLKFHTKSCVVPFSQRSEDTGEQNGYRLPLSAHACTWSEGADLFVVMLISFFRYFHYLLIFHTTLHMFSFFFYRRLLSVCFCLQKINNEIERKQKSSGNVKRAKKSENRKKRVIN